MYLQEGEILTVQELLYGLMLHSGNDAAMALAIYCGGTMEGFAQLMNDKAHALGLQGTHFVNPHGLDSPGHYSTARDLAVLTAYAMSNPVFAQTVSTKTVTVGSRSLRNHNKLLWQLEGAEGVKTGYTKAAGRILVSSTIRDGRRLVAVTINAPDDWNDHKVLIENGYKDYCVTKLIDVGQCIGTAAVVGSNTEEVALLAAESFSFSLRREEKVQFALSGPGFVYAPVEENQEAGFVHVLVDGAPVGKVPLVYGQTAEMNREPERSLWDKIFRRAG